MGQKLARSLAPTLQQQRAEAHSLAPLMILAGAGTGKTTTLIRRITHLILHENIPPEQILALTFSEKAAEELRQRIDEATGAPRGGYAQGQPTGRRITAATFHAFCYQVVLEFQPEFKSRRLMTDGDILFLLRDHYHELIDLQSETFRREPISAAKAFKRFFDRLRDELIPSQRFPDLLARTRERLAGEGSEDWEETHRQLADHCAVFPLYQQWKTEAGMVDYGDMVYECWHLIDSRPKVRRTLQERYRTIIVDEFQDNNYALNMVLGHLAGKHHSVTVVGDDDQCIYSFRGASAYNIRAFRERYQDVSGYGEIILEENHRSTQPILDLANEVIRHNTGRQGKKLAAAGKHEAASRPELWVGSTAAQADHLARSINRVVDEGGAAWGEVAVLTRTHGQAEKVAVALAGREVPCQYLNVRFFQIPAVRTALAWCTVVADAPGTPAAIYRLLREHAGEQLPQMLKDVSRLLRGEQANSAVKDTTTSQKAWDSAANLADRILALRQEGGSLDAAAMGWRILAESGLYRRHFQAGFLEDQIAQDNLTLLLKIAREFTAHHRDNSLGRFVRYMGIMQDAAAVEATPPLAGHAADAVQVMTVHAAKGREFPVVFIPFLQSGSFPVNFRSPGVVDTPPVDWHHWQPDPGLDGKEAHLEEERRLLYVAMTRARKRIILLTTLKRRSIFIRNLPAGLAVETTLTEPDDQEEQTVSDSLHAELKQRLARELSRGTYDQAHQLVDALHLVDQHEAGLAPDFSAHPLGKELLRRLLPEEGQPPSPDEQQAALTLSASAIDSYETCPLQYRFALVERIPGKEDKPYLTFGKIIHAVLEAYHRPGEESRRPILELLEEKWLSEGFTYPQEEEQYKEDARRLLMAYEDRLDQNIPPVVAVEHRFDFELDSVRIKGRIDRIDVDAAGRLTLVDYKTSRRRKTEKEAQKDPQLALYALYIRQVDDIEGRPISASPEKMDLIYYFLRSDEPEVLVNLDEDTLDAFRGRVAEIAAGIRRRDFPHNKGYHCNYCDYKDLVCPAWEQGHR